MAKAQVTEMTVVLVRYRTMLLNARDDGQSRSQKKKKEDKNTTQIRVIPGPFEFVFLVKFEEIV